MEKIKFISIVICTLSILFIRPIISNAQNSADKTSTISCIEKVQQSEMPIFNLDDCDVSNDKASLQFERIKVLHQQMYWTKSWSDEKIKKNIDNSNLCYGVYSQDETQIGFARVVTDFSTVAYLLDVVVDEQYRGKGVGTKLIKKILENSDLKDCTFVLSASEQAKNFYKNLGFQLKNEKYMVCRV